MAVLAIDQLAQMARHHAWAVWFPAQGGDSGRSIAAR
jgi:hypothetical protein